MAGLWNMSLAMTGRKRQEWNAAVMQNASTIRATMAPWLRMKPKPCFMLVRTDTTDFSGMNLIRSSVSGTIGARNEMPLLKSTRCIPASCRRCPEHRPDHARQVELDGLQRYGVGQILVDQAGDQRAVRRSANGSMLEIIPSEGARGSNQMKDPGIRHLAIAVDDFDTAHAHLKKQGVRFLGEPVNTQGNRLVFFADGDGNIVHLVQREKPLP